MIDWDSMQTYLFRLVDYRQYFWQWGSIGICLAGVAAIIILLRRNIFVPGSKQQKVFSRFFDPNKRISGIPVIFCFLLWITWAVRSNWSAKLVEKCESYLPGNYIYTATLLVSAFVLYQLSLIHISEPTRPY